MFSSAILRPVAFSTRFCLIRTARRADHLHTRHLHNVLVRNRSFSTSRCIWNEAAVPTSLDVFTEEEWMLRESGMFLKGWNTCHA